MSEENVTSENDARGDALFCASPKENASQQHEPSPNLYLTAPSPVRKGRERLPKGWKEKAILSNYGEAERFLHVNEHVEMINERIRQRWPEEPHLEVARRDVNRPLLRLYGNGTLVRTQYGDSPNYIFHGLPRFVETNEWGRKTYKSLSYAPKADLLDGFAGVRPDFLSHETDEVNAYNSAQEQGE